MLTGNYCKFVWWLCVNFDCQTWPINYNWCCIHAQVQLGTLALAGLSGVVNSLSTHIKFVCRGLLNCLSPGNGQEGCTLRPPTAPQSELMYLRPFAICYVCMEYRFRPRNIPPMDAVNRLQFRAESQTQSFNHSAS